MSIKNNHNLTSLEVELLNKEIKHIISDSKQNMIGSLIGVWIGVAVLCVLTMLVSNDIEKKYILISWIGFGLVLNIWGCVETYLKTRKMTNKIKNAIATNNRNSVDSILRDISPSIRNLKNEDIVLIEKKLNMMLPDYYKTTIINYPFPKGSFAEYCLLPYYPEYILKNNEESISTKPDGMKPFVIGHYSDEETYFIDLNSDKTGVYIYSIEKNSSQLCYKSWDEYLENVKMILQEID